MHPYFSGTSISLYSTMIGIGSILGILVAVLRMPKINNSIYCTQNSTFRLTNQFGKSISASPLSLNNQFGKPTFASSFHSTSKLNVLFCCLYALAFGLLGAKLFYVFGNIHKVIDGTLTMYQVLASGFMFYGGLFGGFIGIILYCKLLKIKILPMLDTIAVGLPLGQCFGRIGCFMSGCCYGVPTSSIIGVVFTNPANLATPIGIPLVPTQLIESAFCFCLFIFLFLYGAKKTRYNTFARRTGSIFALYCIIYAVGRFIIEFWRGDNERGFVGALSWSQFIGILIFIALAVAYTARLIKRKKTTST